MKIVHIITRLVNGGADENTVISCNWAARNGKEVVLIHGAVCQDEIRSKIDPEVRVVIVPDMVRRISPVREVKALLHLIALLRDIRPDIVHTHTSKAGILGRTAARFAGLDGIVHGIHIAPFLNVGRLEKAAYLAAEKLVARWTKAFISVGEGMRDAYRDARIGTPEQHYIIHSGMNIAAFQHAEIPAELSSRLAPTQNSNRSPVVLMLAAFEDRKRHVEFLEAIGPLFERHPDARIVFGGDGVNRRAIQAAIARCPKPDNVVLLGYFPNPHELIAMADVAALCSVREGLPRVVVQYVAGGCPPVVSELPGIDEIVESGVNGYVIPSGDLAALVAKIADLLDDPVHRQKIARACRGKDLSRWCLETMCKQQDVVYEKVLAG